MPSESCPIFHLHCYGHPQFSQNTSAAFNYSICVDREQKWMLLMSGLNWGRSQGANISLVCVSVHARMSVLINVQ